MYLCGVQKSRGFFNLNLGGWCDFGYVLEDCPSIAAALVFDQGLPLNDIVFGDPCERSLGLNVRYACPIQGKEYENCPDCIEIEGVGMADICDRYSERAHLQGAKTCAFMLGRSSQPSKSNTILQFEVD